MIRRSDTRALRRAVATLGAYQADTRPLSRNRHSDALAGHLEGMVAENRKLRGEVLALRERMDRTQSVHGDLLASITASLKGLQAVDFSNVRPDLVASQSADDGPEAA